MIPYLIFYAIVFALSFKIKKGKFTFFDYLLIFVIIFFSAVRTVGVDYSLYRNQFSFLNLSSTITSRTGIGYAYLAYFVKFFLNADYQMTIIISSFITNIFVYIFLKKYSSRPGLAILIYISFGFYTTSFNMFRQTLSMAFVLHGIKKYDEENFIISLILFLIGFLIHSSSILATVFYILFFKFKKLKINFILLFLPSFFIIVFYNQLYPLIIGYFSKYEMYLNYNSSPGVGTYLMVFVFIIIYFILFYRKRNDICKYEHVNTFYNIMSVGIAIMILEFRNFLFFRFAFYFTFIISILLVDYYEISNLKNNKLLSLLFYICMLIYFIVYILSFDGVVPYNWIF